MPCPIPGLCSHSPDCQDKQCHGADWADPPLVTPEEAAMDALIFWAAIAIVVIAFGTPIVLTAIDYFSR